MGGLGARAHLASGSLPGCGWPRWCGGAAACWLDTESLPSLVSLSGLGTLGLTAGVLRRAGLMPSSVVLGHTVGAWVPVGLLSGLVVGHPVRERRPCCRR